jgi:hypothetical protein
MKVTNFAGSSVTLFGGSTGASGDEAENIAFDGVGQNVTLNLQDFVQTSDGTLTVTGVDGLTIAGDSTSQLTGNADQDNALGVVTANSANTISVSSNGSAASNAGALTIASISATAAESATLTVGALDDVEISASLTTGADVETATVTLGDDSQLTIAAKIDLSTSTVDTMTITLGAGSFLSASNANTTIATNEEVEIDAGSIADLNIDLSAAAVASLNLSGVEITDGDATLATSSNLVLENSIGVASTASNFTVSGRGDLDIDDSSDLTDGNNLTLVGY